MVSPLRDAMSNYELNLILAFGMGALSATALIAIIALITDRREAKLLIHLEATLSGIIRKLDQLNASSRAKE
jgi:hypothetical protein